MSLLKIEILQRQRREIINTASDSRGSNYQAFDQFEDIVIITMADTEKSRTVLVREYCNGGYVGSRRWTWSQDSPKSAKKFEDEVVRAMNSGYYLLPEGANINIPGISFELDFIAYSATSTKSETFKSEARKENFTENHRRLSV